MNPAKLHPPPHPPDIILVGCVKTKRPARSPAKDLYTSPLWRCRQAYAESRGVPWYILSALHGLLDPDRRIDPYELALDGSPDQGPARLVGPRTRSIEGSGAVDAGQDDRDPRWRGLHRPWAGRRADRRRGRSSPATRRHCGDWTPAGLVSGEAGHPRKGGSTPPPHPLPCRQTREADRRRLLRRRPRLGFARYGSGPTMARLHARGRGRASAAGLPRDARCRKRLAPPAQRSPRHVKFRSHERYRPHRPPPSSPS